MHPAIVWRQATRHNYVAACNSWQYSGPRPIYQRRFVATIGLPLCSSFPPIVWRWAMAPAKPPSMNSSLQSNESLMAPSVSSHVMSFPASTMTGRRRPRRGGQNGSNERLFWSLAVIIVVLVVSYWCDGGDDDAAKQNKGEYDQSCQGCRSANRKVGRGPGKFCLPVDLY